MDIPQIKYKRIEPGSYSGKVELISPCKDKVKKLFLVSNIRNERLYASWHHARDMAEGQGDLWSVELSLLAIWGKEHPGWGDLNIVKRLHEEPIIFAFSGYPVSDTYKGAKQRALFEIKHWTEHRSATEIEDMCWMLY